ncbi:chromate transporter [Halomonas piscis]|uniref:chromate transporter n=1 Tax=Halomonas piscis TaxID=3031727 RepID=UPI00289AE5A1|nr:chromate transporter [Halomonas piscis]
MPLVWRRHVNPFLLVNALPSPIATKMAGYIGYDVAGVLGALIAIFATVAPSLLLMLIALGTLYRYRDSIKVKSMSQWRVRS